MNLSLGNVVEPQTVRVLVAPPDYTRARFWHNMSRAPIAGEILARPFGFCESLKERERCGCSRQLLGITSGRATQGAIYQHVDRSRLLADFREGYFWQLVAEIYGERFVERHPPTSVCEQLCCFVPHDVEADPGARLRVYHIVKPWGVRTYLQPDYAYN